MKGKYLTADQIQKIEKLLQDPELSLQAIAERMSLSHRVICAIHKRLKLQLLSNGCKHNKTYG